MSKQDGFSGTNLNLKTLIANAYQIREDLISGGPAWVGTTGFDVEAKVAGEDLETLKKLTRVQRMSMLQNLLATRLKLVVRTESRVLPSYDLVIAKGGSKLIPAPADEVAEDMSNHPDAKRHPGGMSVGPTSSKQRGCPCPALRVRSPQCCTAP